MTATTLLTTARHAGRHQQPRQESRIGGARRQIHDRRRPVTHAAVAWLVIAVATTATVLTLLPITTPSSPSSSSSSLLSTRFMASAWTWNAAATVVRRRGAKPVVAVTGAVSHGRPTSRTAAAAWDRRRATPSAPLWPTTPPSRRAATTKTFTTLGAAAAATPPPSQEVTTKEATASSSSSSITTSVENIRLPLQGLSLDLRTLSSQWPVVLSHLQARRANADTIAAAQQLSIDVAERSRLIKQRDAFLETRREASDLVGRLVYQHTKSSSANTNGTSDNSDNMDDNDVTNAMTDEQNEQLHAAKERSQIAADGAAEAEEQLQALQQQMDAQLARLPNLLDDRVPDGDTDADNVLVSAWGDVTALPQRLGWTSDFTPLWHDDIATALGGYQAEAAVKLSGTRFVALSGSVARLERAITNFFVDLHTSDAHGYTEVSVPLVVGRSALEGTSQLPKFQEDLFAISPSSHTCNGEDAFLIPTAEVPVTNLHRDTVLDESDLPLRYVAATPCFRAEAGSSGRDTRGLIRTHQFLKVELVQITTAETSNDQHEQLTLHAENCLKALQLPYRKVRLCSGDIGFAARHCYDLEVWLPGAGEYREISSCSNCGDFQARRMGLRYRPAPAAVAAGSGKNKKDKKKPKPQFCHTLNGSGLAVGRALVAVLENYQRPDGSVEVPEVLRPYMGGVEILEVPK